MSVTDTEYVRGAARLAQRIRTLRAALSLPVLENEIGQLLLRRTLQRFDNEVDPDGRPWAPLSTETLRRRKRKGGKQGKKILVQTGAMRAAIRRIRGSASGLIAVNTGAGFRIGVADKEQTGKAAAHQFGTAGIPVRRFLGIGRLDVKSVDSFLRRRADTALR